MTNELHNLEREIDAELASWASELEVKPREALVPRVQAAVRHELNEAWLADLPTPKASPELTTRVRDAVHAELESGRRTRGPGFHWSPAWSSIASAAAIGICVGIIHLAGTLKTSSPTEVQTTDRYLDQFVEAAEEVLDDETMTSDLMAEMDALSERIAQWQPADDEEAEVIDNLLDEFDELLSTPEPSEGTGQAPSPSRGAIA